MVSEIRKQVLRDCITVSLFDKEEILNDVNGYVDWKRVVNCVFREIEQCGFVIEWGKK